MFISTQQRRISKCTSIKCLLKTNLASSVKPSIISNLLSTFTENFNWLCHKDVLLLVHSVTEPILSVFARVMKKISNKEYKPSFFWVIFCRHSIATWNKLGAIFNPCSSLPTLATDDRKQFQCLSTTLNGKTGPLFLEYNWCQDTF